MIDNKLTIRNSTAEFLIFTQQICLITNYLSSLISDKKFIYNKNFNNTIII
jgi:hypothetical protein